MKVHKLNTILMIHKGGTGGVRGSEYCFVESAKALVDVGFKVVVCRNLHIMDEILAEKVAAIEQLRFPEIMVEGLSVRFPLLQYIKEFGRLYSLVKKWNPQVIYANGGLPCQLAVPVGKLVNVPILCHFHHPADKRAYYLWLVKFADRCFFPSQFTRKHSQSKAGVDGDVVYNGVDTGVFRPTCRGYSYLREQLNIPQGGIVVGQVGALERNKRPEMLLGAFARAARKRRDLHLVIIGRGSLEETLRKQVDVLGLKERVRITGFVDSVLPYYQQVIDINVLASYEEGLGISIIEGSACGLPAVIADCSGLRETVIPEKTGYTFPPDDEAELTRLLLHLAENADVRKRLGTAGRQLAEDKFSLSAYRAGVVDLVNRIAGVAW